MQSTNGKLFQDAFLEAINWMGSKTVFIEECTAGPFRFDLLKDGHKKMQMRITGDIDINDPWIKERMDTYRHSILTVAFILPNPLLTPKPDGFIFDGEAFICGNVSL